MKRLLLTGLLFTSLISVAASAAVEVAPFRIEELRVTAFSDDHVGRPPASLKLVLSLGGPEAESSVRYGNVKLEEAVDDKGNPITLLKDGFRDPGKFSDYSNAFFRKSTFGSQAPAAPQVELDLAPVARTATKIARLKGTLDLADAGTARTVEAGSLKSAGRKILDMPEGAKLGVTVTAAPGRDVRSLSLEITGDASALESIDVMDASGKKVSSGTSSWALSGGPTHKSITLAEPLDEAMKLVAKVTTGRKITTVPFDLKEIALP